MLGLEDAGWAKSAIDMLRANSALAAPLCFALGFGESIAFISLFVPSTILFLGIGGVYSAAGGSFVEVWLAGAAGAFLGDIVSYAVGRYFKDDVDRVWPFTKTPALLPKSRALFERWGFLSIIVGKFIGGLRPFLPVVAGVSAMPWGSFLAASAVSCLIWAGAFLGPGFGLGAAFGQ